MRPDSFAQYKAERKYSPRNGHWLAIRGCKGAIIVRGFDDMPAWTVMENGFAWALSPEPGSPSYYELVVFISPLVYDQWFWISKEMSPLWPQIWP